MEQTEKKKGGRNIFIIVLCVIVIVAIGVFMMKPWEKLDNPDNLESVDLTTMSSTMVYAYVNDMVNTRPEAYIGKTVKARGEYYKSYYSQLDEYYHFVIISDATACCAQGLKFVYDGGDFPDDNTDIIIEGTFQKYDELGTTYYHIVVAALSVV